MYRVYFREIKSEDLDLLGSQNVYCKEKKFFALLEVMAMAAWDNCLVSKKRNVILVYFRKCDLSKITRRKCFSKSWFCSGSGQLKLFGRDIFWLFKL